jgi:hypothetical protein
MRYRYVLILLTFGMSQFSCKKDPLSPPTNPPDVPPLTAAEHILLKDIIIPNLPSPYYHFEYNQDSLISRVNFASGFSIYDVVYDRDRIGEMRNNIIVNHDTLRYSYDPAGSLHEIDFINESNIIYRHVHFIYEGRRIKEIDWEVKQDDSLFFTDRTVTFSFYPDDNLKTMVDDRPAVKGSPEQIFTTLFEQYDSSINVDDFSLIHDTYHDHLFLFQEFRLQKNNPGKETFSVNDVMFYHEDFAYIYNTDSTPSSKKVDFVYTSGPNTGQKFETTYMYTYY